MAADALFYVVRHGETQWNREARIQGQSDSALTREGRAQADAIGRRLAKEPFHAMLSSDLGRAADTARAIAKHTGMPIAFDQRLRERHFGAGQGMTYEEVGRAYPGAFSREANTNPDTVIPGGETRRQFHQRVISAFDDLAREHAGRRVIVVTHGGLLAVMYRHVHGIPIEQPHGVPITNACVNVIAWRGGRWIVDLWADDAHLEAAEPFVED